MSLVTLEPGRIGLHNATEVFGGVARRPPNFIDHAVRLESDRFAGGGLAVVTNQRVFRIPTPLTRALHDVEVWMESPGLRLIGEPATYWPHLRDALAQGAVAGAAVHDARIAAICRSHGVSELLTADRDFSRFPWLTIKNPLRISLS